MQNQPSSSVTSEPQSTATGRLGLAGKRVRRRRVPPRADMSGGAMALSAGLSRRRKLESAKFPAASQPSLVPEPAPAEERAELLPPTTTGNEPARPSAKAQSPSMDDAEQRYAALAREHERLQSELASVISSPKTPIASAPSPELAPTPLSAAARDPELGASPAAAEPAQDAEEPEPEAEVQLTDVVPDVSVGSQQRVITLRKSPAGFGFRVGDNLLIDALTDATGPAALVDPPFPLGWYVRQCDDVPVYTREDLAAYLEEGAEEVSFTVESPPPTDDEEDNVLDATLATDEATDELLKEYCSCLPQWLRDCFSAVFTSCIWMVVSTLWDVMPWLVPFGMFMRSLSLQVESGIQVVVLMLFLATPIISMRYHGNSETQRHSLGDGWNIVFVGLGTLLTISFVQVFLFILYDEIDSFFDLQLDGDNSTAAPSGQNRTLSDPLDFGLAIFKAEFLPDDFNKILDKYAFGKILLAAPPGILVVLVLVLNICARMTKTKIANDSLSSELYSCGYFLWFYSLWLLLLDAKGGHYAEASVDSVRDQFSSSSVESVETVSYLTNCCAFIFMSFSIAVQEASGPTKSNDMAKTMETKYFSTNVGYEGMFWLFCMWLNGTVAIVTTYVWTYQRETGNVWPFLAGLLVSLMYVCVYWYHVVWWYSYLHTRHRAVTDSLSVSQPGSAAASIPCWRRMLEVFSPESSQFYTKQAMLEAIDLMAQSYRSWGILVVAVSGRFGPPAWYWVVVVAFAGLVCFHGVSSMMLMFNLKAHSPYVTLKFDLTVDMCYVVGGLVASIFLWTVPDKRGLPLCGAFTSDWLTVIATMVPLVCALWSLPTVIVRSAIFMSNKRPAQGGLRRLFDAIDADGSGSLDAEEIGKLCEDMGAKLSDEELELAVRAIDTDGSGEVSFDEFCEWIMGATKGKVAMALSRFRASGLRENAEPPLPTGCWKWSYAGCTTLATFWAVAVMVFAYFLDTPSNFFASMDENNRSTTLATFKSTFDAYSAAGKGADTTASFLVLDKYTALRFEDLDVPAGATVVDATLSFIPYVPDSTTQPEYCLDTNNLGDAANGVVVSEMDVTTDTVTVSATDASSIVAGQKLRLADAAGQSCGATPSGDGSVLVVTSVVGGVIKFSAELRGVQMTLAELAKCVLKRAVCTSPTQIDQGKLSVKALISAVDGKVDATAKPADDAALSAAVVAEFKGGQNFAISGINGVITAVVAEGTSWVKGNTVELYLELAIVQAESPSCRAAEAKHESCHFPKQLLAADCDSPLLRVKYTVPPDVEEKEATAVAWPSEPKMSP